MLKPLAELGEGELYAQLAIEDDRRVQGCYNLENRGAFQRALDAEMKRMAEEMRQEINRQHPLLAIMAQRPKPTRWQRIKRALSKRPHFQMDWY